MLDLYKNIKERRLELKMSQDALAELTGYKDRSSIAKIEKGEVDISESKIREFAKALKISPQELMGWDEPEKPVTIAAHFDGDDYTAEELDRINELARLSKTRELTNAEKSEQKKLRDEYIRLVHNNLRGQLQNIRIVEKDGSITSLKKK